MEIFGGYTAKKCQVRKCYADNQNLGLRRVLSQAVIINDHEDQLEDDIYNGISDSEPRTNDSRARTLICCADIADDVNLCNE